MSGAASKAELQRVMLYRDVLTELMLRAPVARPGLFRLSDPPPPAQFNPRFGSGADRPALYDGSQTLAVVGLGAGLSGEGAELVIFAEEHSARTEQLSAQLGRESIASRVVAPVTFRAAGPRPVQGGHSVGRGIAGGESGTFGCVVQGRRDAKRYGLTCNHVIAALNTATRGSTEVWAPSAPRGGSGADRVGVVHDFHDIDFQPTASNFIDAALILPDKSGDLDPAIAGIGRVAGVNNALVFGDLVKKTGVVSGHTTG